MLNKGRYKGRCEGELKGPLKELSSANKKQLLIRIIGHV
jgi:hypothetical protein